MDTSDLLQLVLQLVRILCMERPCQRLAYQFVLLEPLERIPPGFVSIDALAEHSLTLI